MNKQKSTPSQPLLTKEELALKLKCSVSTIDNYIRKGKLKPLKMGRRCLFDPSKIKVLAG